jgi:hypothetical protein
MPGTKPVPDSNHPPAPPSADASLCVGCGLCCDGTLHTKTTVKPDDEAIVAAAGLEVVEGGGKRSFRQPCRHFSCGQCSIYAARPGVCRSYRCALLISLEDGTITKPDALEKVSMARKLLAVVRKADPTAVTPADRSALAEGLKLQLAQLEGPARQPVAKRLLEIAVLEHFLNRWFLKEPGENNGSRTAKGKV